MATQTATMRLSKPTTGADQAPLWGNYLDADMDLIDRAVNQVISINIPDANVILLADGTTNDQALYQGYSFTGTQSTSRSVTIPNVSRFGRANNLTTGGFSVLLTTGVGNAAAIPPNGIFYKYWVDGSGNVNLLAPEQFPSFGSTNSVGVALSNSTPRDITSLSLTAGDYDVSGSVTFRMSSSSPGASFVEAWSSTVSASAPPALGSSVVILPNSASFTVTSCAIPSQRYVLTSTTTIYLSAEILITTGNCTGTGYINARLMG